MENNKRKEPFSYTNFPENVRQFMDVNCPDGDWDDCVIETTRTEMQIAAHNDTIYSRKTDDSFTVLATLGTYYLTKAQGSSSTSCVREIIWTAADLAIK